MSDPPKVLLCFGTRPEAIKLAPVVSELGTQNIRYEICVSGQHREMLDQVLSFFNIVPTYDLDLMQPDQNLNDFSSRFLRSFDEVLVESRPDLLIVHGDTTTSTIAAIASYHRNIPVAHVEAGLRTYNPSAPFPEEVNRQLTARVANFHFAPTQKARQNLLNEYIQNERIFVTGNTIVDALNYGKQKITSFNPNTLKENCGLQNAKLENFVLITGHRRENFGAGFKNICDALTDLARLDSNIDFVFPVHLNPKVKQQVSKNLSQVPGVHLIEPVNYPTMIWLMANCRFIISDSGGIQEEAPTFGKKVLVTRDFSERMEGVEAGCSILVGTDKEKIIAEASVLLKESTKDKAGENPYGDGKAAKRIVDILRKKLE